MEGETHATRAIWWRFNGYGYFCGMLVGLIASTIKLLFFSSWIDIYFFPIIFVLSILGCLFGSLLTPPDDMEKLKTLMFFHKLLCNTECLLLETTQDNKAILQVARAVTRLTVYRAI